MIAFVIKRSASNIIKRFGHAITWKRQNRSVALKKTPCKWAGGFYIYIKTRPSYLIRFIKASSGGEYNCHIHIISNLPIIQRFPFLNGSTTIVFMKQHNHIKMGQQQNVGALKKYLIIEHLKTPVILQVVEPHLGSYAKAWDKGQHHQGLVSQLGEFQGDMIQRQQTKMTRSQFLGMSAYSHVSFPLLGCIW